MERYRHPQFLSIYKAIKTMSAYIHTTGIQRYISIVFAILLVASCSQTVLAQDTIKLLKQAASAIDELEQGKSPWIENLTPGSLNQLPIGLKRTVNNIEYKIAISHATIYEDHAELTAWAKVTVPAGDGKERTMFFGVDKLLFSYEGGISSSGGRLMLLGDVEIPINKSSRLKLKGGFNISSGQAVDGYTSLSIDCQGFKELIVDADVLFSRNMLIPCNNNGDTLSNVAEQVSGHFNTVITDWNDMVVNIKLPKFQVKHLNDFVFTATEAVFDFSDIRNASKVVFPDNYAARYLNDMPNIDLWRGVYVKNVEVALPRQFKNKNNPNRIYFIANNLIVDNNGLTGKFYSNARILPYESGSASGWKFSVDGFGIEIEANRLLGGKFNGRIGLPVADQTALAYQAEITADNQYRLMVNPVDSIVFSIWQAKAKLDANSYVKMEVNNGIFLPEANLSGIMTLEAKSTPEDTKSVAKFDGLKFRGMRIKTQAPYFSVEYLGYEGDVKLAGFPVSIQNIRVTSNNDKAYLTFGMNLALAKDKFKASTELSVSARLNHSNGMFRWEYDKTTLNEVVVDNAEIAGLKFAGRLLFRRDDPIYGDGFAGEVSAIYTIGRQAMTKISASAVFGCSTFRYWYVDGSAEFSKGIPIAGVLSIAGFSGGAYYGMSQKPGYVQNGMNANGLKYVPNEKIGLGLKAGVAFTNSGKDMIKGYASLEMSFNKSGGLNFIGLYGHADIMSDKEKSLLQLDKANALVAKAREKEALFAETLINQEDYENKIFGFDIEKQKSPDSYAESLNTELENTKGIWADLGISYDFERNTFHANFQININTAGSLIQGVGSGYKAGYATLHFAPDEWYVHIGTPTDPLGIQFGVGNFRVRTKSYLMAGTKIPASPPPPKEVADILGADANQLNYMKDLNALGEGKGMAFGSSITINTGDLTFLILYANFKAGLGFDVMLKEYNNVKCKGSNKEIGINGWYGNAQAYAYLQGELGVKVKLFLIKKRIPVIKGATAALLQAKLPNPSIFEGYLGVNVHILGGLINTRMRFHLRLGDNCELEKIDGTETPVAIDVIADLTPIEKENVNVFAAPQLALNFAANKAFAIPGEQGDNQYMINVDKFELTASEKIIPGITKWNARKDILTFYSKEVLPPSTPIRVEARVSFKEYKNGSWQTLYIDGKKVEEIRTLNFITGLAPESIPLENVEYSWPVVNQNNFYSGESTQGYIQLKRGQKYLFNVAGYKQSLLLTDGTGKQIESDFQYNESLSRIIFSIPDKLEQDKRYAFAIVSKPLLGTDEGSSQKDSFSIINNNKAENLLRTDIGKNILSFDFKTSIYSLFKDKMQTVQTRQTITQRIASDVISMRLAISNMKESFDLAELTGTTFTNYQPLVQPVAVASDSYYTNSIYPLLYQQYPLGNITISARDTAVYGLTPVRALTIAGSYLSMITQENYSNSEVLDYLPYVYDLPRVYKSDFLDLQSQIVNKYLGTRQQADYKKFIEGYFPFITNGDYEVDYRYVLPDGKIGSSFKVKYRKN